MTSPLSISMPPSSAAAGRLDAGKYLYGLECARGAQERAGLRRNRQGRVGAGRGAVPADDAEEHARCGRGGRRADSNETGMYQDMFDKQVALTLSKRQDLGIARLFERQLGGKAAGAARRRRRLRHRNASSCPRAVLPDTRRPRRAAADRRESLRASRPNSCSRCCRPSAARPPLLGVNPLGMLAQAALETGWGQRMPRTADGNPSLNLFGIKAGERLERRARRGGYRGVQRRRGDAAPHRFSRLRLHRGERQRLRPLAHELAALSRGGRRRRRMPRPTCRASPRPDTPPIREYANKLNEVLNSGTLRAALGARLAKL